MAPLPNSRVQIPDRVFEKVGVDYAGPFLTKQGRCRTRNKRYLCLFTCLSVRAVHLEMAYDLSTDAFINCFWRFSNRRGNPAYVVSDNGTNFVGASKELMELTSSLDQDEIQSHTSMEGVKWEFNPPNAPHFGGVFESMIKAAKRAIYAQLGNAEVNDEQLNSIFIIEAESLINSRPLTYPTASEKDVPPLTPNHFIIGNENKCLGKEIDASTPFHPNKRWTRT